MGTYNNKYNPKIINLNLARIAAQEEIPYRDLVEFLYENRSLPEFEHTFDIYDIAGVVYEYRNYRKIS